MRLWIDGQFLQTASSKRGIGRYVNELLNTIRSQHGTIDLSISFNAAMADTIVSAREAVENFIDHRNIHVWHGVECDGEAVAGYTPERQLNEIAISHHVNCVAPDVAISASPFEGGFDMACPLLPGNGIEVPVSSIFYDLIPYRYKERYLNNPKSEDYYFRRLNKLADFDDHMCISEFSRNELLSLYPRASSINIGAGVTSNLGKSETPDSDVGLDGPFILYVGGLDWRKNVECVISAFTELDKQLPDNRLTFVIAGDAPADRWAQLRAYWMNCGLAESRFIGLGHVSESQLRWLYSKAKILVQPSFMEGFGLTALEAIYFNTPVVASHSGALPEVVGLDELLFDPNSSSQLAEKIVSLISTPARTRKLMERAKAHAENFTWQRSAGLAVERLSQIAAKSRTKPHVNRRRIANIAGKLDLDTATAAKTLALAEIQKDDPLLIVDVTATTLADHKTGIQRVVRNICREIKSAESANGSKTVLGFCDDDSGWFEVDDDNLSIPAKTGSRLLPNRNTTLLMLDSSWEKFQIHRKFMQACRIRGGKVVSVLYDFVPLHYSAFCDPGMPGIFSRWFESALLNSTGVVCISKAVADELLLWLEGVKYPNRLHVGYWQLGADFASRSHSPPVGNGVRPNFLMVGTLEPRKGHTVALDAFDQLWGSGVDVELTIVGKKGWRIDHIVNRIREHNEYGKRLHWHENATDAELIAHYARGDALIAASYAEGFGLPIVEAGQFGKPVIASDIPVFREVARGANSATFFKLGDSRQLAQKIVAFIKNGSEEAETTPQWPTWAQSAQQLKDIVLRNDWYHVYEPPVGSANDADSYGLGATRMRRPLTEEDRKAEIALVEGPLVSEGENIYKILVTVKNKSSSVWSSEGDSNGLFGINLSYILLSKDGDIIKTDNLRTRIPLVIIPEGEIYLPIVVPLSTLPMNATKIEIRLVQEGVSWFDDPLVVDLPSTYDLEVSLNNTRA